MKYLFALALFALALLILYRRLRPYVNAARRFYGFIRDARGLSADMPRATAARGPARATAEKLVRCSACATWLPASRALTSVAPRQVYCSDACLEHDPARPHQTRTPSS